MTPPTPSYLIPVVDQAVAHALEGVPLPPRLHDLQQWIETEALDELFAHAGDCQAVAIDRLADTFFSDQVFCEFMGQPRSAPICDEERAGFARYRAWEAWDPDEGGEYLDGIDYFPLKDSLGREALLMALSAPGGQAGPRITWLGIFGDRQSAIDFLNRAGSHWLAETLGKRSDEEFLAKWRERDNQGG